MQYIYMLPGAFLAPVIHGWAKAAISARLGDPTPKNKGFLSGNPLKYFEIIGFILMLLVGYGWGQPVPTSAMYYKDRRNGVLLTHIMPSVISLLVGVIAAAAYGLIAAYMSFSWTAGSPGWTVSAVSALFEMLRHFARLNIGMAFFALIPVYPLNGARILQLFLRPEHVAKMTQYEKVFQILLILLLILGFINMFLSPLVNVLTESIINMRYLFYR
jgi:Zn-dependent protease